ncbi:MAG: hypothetical protein DWI24_00835 [Planctomycetota bacterium]|nr:MAG: hypothetical protein DWI24_00835 [Planctomycetota bacterium]
MKSEKRGMNYRSVSLCLVSSLTCALVIAQDDATARPRPPRPSLVTQLHHSTEYKTPFTPDALHDHPEFFPQMETNPGSDNYHPGAAKSVVRNQTVPYRTDNNSFGFRNPGHLAKVAEYYAPGEKFDSAPHDPIHPATYNEQTAALSRNAQIQAYNAGTARYNAVMQSIYAYSRPMGGFGFGMF